MTETTLAAPVAIKELTDDAAVVAGYGVLWGGVDVTGEYFTPDTDFQLDYVPVKAVFYDHSLRDEPELEDPIGRVVKITPDDRGLWVEAELHRSHAYTDRVLKLVERGALGYSSGAIAHLVRKEKKSDGVFIKRWTIAEVSLTPTPAEPRTVGVERIKAAQPADSELPNDNTAPTAPPQASAEAPAAQPVQGGATMDGTARPDTKTTITMMESDPMPETPGDNDVKYVTEDAFTQKMDEIKKLLEDSPALKNSGYYSADGGKADPTVKSFGDFLMAVMRKDDVRLKSVYHSIKDVSTDSGTSGGYLIPSDYSQQLLQAVSQTSPIVSSVQQYRVSVPSGEWPALDIWTAPTAGVGNTAKAGKVTASKRAEGGTYAETQPEFETIKWRVHDVASGYVEVTREMREDSPTAIEGLLRSLFTTVVANKLEYYILRGNGVGEPLGVFNAAAKIDITPDSNGVFAFADAVEMISRYKNVSGRSTQWIIHPGMITDIAAFQVTANNAVTFVTDMGGALRRQLLGYQLLDSEHMPAPDASMCVLLWDPGAYALWLRGEMYVDFSEHAAFTAGKDAWRFGQRVDGQPLWKGTQTLADPGGAFTVSPFVAFND